MWFFERVIIFFTQFADYQSERPSCLDNFRINSISSKA